MITESYISQMPRTYELQFMHVNFVINSVYTLQLMQR